MVYIPRRQQKRRLDSRVGEVVQMPAVASASAHTLSALSKVLDNVATKMAPAILSFYQDERETKNNSQLLEFKTRADNFSLKHIKQGSSYEDFEVDFQKEFGEIEKEEWTKGDSGLNGKKAANHLADIKRKYAINYFNKELPKVEVVKIANIQREYNDEASKTSAKFNPEKLIHLDNEYRRKAEQVLEFSFKHRYGKEAKDAPDEYKKFKKLPKNEAILRAVDDTIVKTNYNLSVKELKDGIERGDTTLTQFGFFIGDLKKTLKERKAQLKKNEVARKKGEQTTTMGEFQYLKESKNPRFEQFKYLLKNEGLQIGQDAFLAFKLKSLRDVDNKELIAAREDLISKLTDTHKKLSAKSMAEESKERANEAAENRANDYDIAVKLTHLLSGGSIKVNGVEVEGEAGFNKLIEQGRRDGAKVPIGSWEYHNSTKKKVTDKHRKFTILSRVEEDFDKDPTPFPTDKTDLRGYLEEKYSKTFPNANVSDLDYVANQLIRSYGSTTKKRRATLNGFKTNIKSLFKEIQTEFGKKVARGRKRAGTSSGELFPDTKKLDLVKLTILNDANQLQQELTDTENPISDTDAAKKVKEFYNTNVSKAFHTLIKNQLINLPMTGKKAIGPAGRAPLVDDPLETFLSLDFDQVEEHKVSEPNFIPSLKNRLWAIYRELPKGSMRAKSRLVFSVKLLNTIESSPRTMAQFRGTSLGKFQKGEEKPKQNFAVKNVVK